MRSFCWSANSSTVRAVRRDHGRPPHRHDTRVFACSSASPRARRSLIKGYLRFCTRRRCVLMSSSCRGEIVSEAFQRMTKSSDPTSDMTRNSANKRIPSSLGIFAPLRYGVFRRIWIASLLSNLGLLILGVGAAWAMTKLSSSTGMVALVQTFLMLPIALVSTPAGAIADMFDRRIVGLVALAIALAGSISISALAWLGVMTPVLLLVSCFVIGSGMALFGPAWQASASEQVPAEALPSAVALNGISYNIARSFGPAIGGVIVASAGAVAAFVTNALLYLPLLIVLFLWRPVAAAAGKTGACCYFGRSLHRALAVYSNCAVADLGYRDCRRFSLSAHADRRARPPAWRRSNLRRHAGGVWHGRGDRSAQYFHASWTSGRRSFDPPMHDRHGRLCRRCRHKPLASADWKRARLRGCRLDGSPGPAPADLLLQQPLGARPARDGAALPRGPEPRRH